MVTHSFPCSPLEQGDLNTRIGEQGAGARGNMQTIMCSILAAGKLALFASWIDLEKVGLGGLVRLQNSFLSCQLTLLFLQDRRMTKMFPRRLMGST